jgi:maltose/moltooligosaccharide transporter
MAKENFQHKLLFLCASHTLLHVYTNLPIALLPILISDYGLSIILASVIVSIPRVVSLVFSIPSGLLADRLDHTKLISFSLFLDVFAAILIFLFRNIEIAVLGFSLIALASTFYHPPALSAASNISPQNYLSRALGFHGASGTFGISLGPITMGLVLNWFEWRYVYLLWVAPIFFIAVTAFFVTIDERPNEGSYDKRTKKHPTTPLRDVMSAAFLSFMLLMLCASAASGAISTYLTTYLTQSKGLEASLAAIIFGLSPLIGLTSVITGGYTGDKLGWRRSLTLIISTTTVALFFMFVSTSTIQTVSFYFVYGFFNIMTMPITTSLVAKIVPRKSRGTAYSLQFIPESVIGIVMPITLGILIDLLEIWVIFPIAIIFFIIALIITRIIQIQ